MSDYIYKNSTDRLEINSAAMREDECFMAVIEKGTSAGIFIPNADVPTVALELLNAAGQESVLVPKAYEEVEQLGDEITCGSGPEAAHARMAMNPNWLRNGAANMIALAEYIESAATREAAEKAEAEAAEKKLQERRDALLRDFRAGGAWDYTSELAQLAIDRIIELEDKLASRD
ncbi:hypothetical protein KKR91_01300 [Arthrobacter jiangjiafuii]|uniref:Uncharacterized protein n=1 Tax=Arthrobacter jiangjiafuii TaxID=2817475 RepID=A0A975M5P7_9MICC|nr:hypothetical protein [Arthrobacter jiangjiafuii]MBP3044856.1 hypothetical protein [Arthrobacter jiangjiafuii]QWC10320.1 hypothetical protein KKR91_01300 [Arthrobacter jiangjiafuii]